MATRTYDLPAEMLKAADREKKAGRTKMASILRASAKRQAAFEAKKAAEQLTLI